MHTHTHAHVYKRIDVQIHTHMHIYTYIHVCTHTHIHIYTHTHTKCIHERRPLQAAQHTNQDSAAPRQHPLICTGCTQIFCRPFNSLCNRSMRAAENVKALIPFCARSSPESSGVSGWLLIKMRAILAFSLTTSLVALSHHSPCLSDLGTGTRH